MFAINGMLSEEFVDLFDVQYLEFLLVFKMQVPQ